MRGGYSVKTKVKKLSIRWKILIPSTILVIAMCAVIGLNSYNRIKTGMIQLGVEQARVFNTCNLINLLQTAEMRYFFVKFIFTLCCICCIIYVSILITAVMT